MLRLFPETRLIVALRDPRDVVLSCYLRYLPLNSVSVRFLDVQRTAERYAFDMSAWLKFRELIEMPWCEVRYEDTVADAEAQARKALATLGLAWDDQVLDYRERLSETKRVTSPSYEAVAQPIYTRPSGGGRTTKQCLEPALETLEPFVREFGYECELAATVAARSTRLAPQQRLGQHLGDVAHLHVRLLRGQAVAQHDQAERAGHGDRRRRRTRRSRARGPDRRAAPADRRTTSARRRRRSRTFARDCAAAR